MQGVAYAQWLGAGLWKVGGLMERRPHYVRLENLRLLATAPGILLCGSWFGVASLAPIMQAGGILLASGSCVALWLTFTPVFQTHGHLSDL